MPFLRVIRDKRGYETTYLMHWQREGNRQHSRILYVFRTPSGVHVGREALEADVLKEIEAQHPDIAFDWGAVFHNRQVVEASTEPRRPRKRPPAEAAVEAPQAQQPPQPQPARPSIPSAIEGTTPDEQVAFLARWYAVVRERIPHRVADPARQDVLLALAERLNPIAWTDADEITAGLQQAAEALERLSHVFAKRRRRSKKRGSGGAPTHADVVGAAEAPADIAAGDESGEMFGDAYDTSDETPDDERDDAPDETPGEAPDDSGTDVVAGVPADTAAGTLPAAEANTEGQDRRQDRRQDRQGTEIDTNTDARADVHTDTGNDADEPPASDSDA